MVRLTVPKLTTIITLVSTVVKTVRFASINFLFSGFLDEHELRDPTTCTDATTAV